MPNLQACVLAAGKGTRMGGDRPKVLFEANGKPLIEWVLSALAGAGVDDCVAVVGFLKEEVIAKLEMIGDLGENNVKYTKLWDAIKAGE